MNSSTYHDADLRIANLEHPIGIGEPIEQKSTLHAPPDAIEYLKELRVDAVCLANNHVQDLGSDAIGETITRLQAAGIDCFGAGCSIREASEPYRVADGLVLLGYCAYDSPSLNKIQVATDETPGVNPLSEQKVKDDLRKLDSDTQAILFVHWGIENTWIPPNDCIQLAHNLLDLPQVAGIIGGHPHRIQGYTAQGANRAYFSLGNFLFPDFDMQPPVSVAYQTAEDEVCYKTKRYHPVTKITRKRWSAAARTSLLVSYDAQQQAFDHTPVYQTTGRGDVQEVTGVKNHLVHDWLSVSSWVIERHPLLRRFALGANLLVYNLWNVLGILLFLLKQNGVRWMVKFLRTAIRAKIDSDIDANKRLYEFFSD
ncbi:CapA family protein [Halovivax cerinus]|uniref:CapA family protein n=1 Tax=Halovivax cerinus TaxID=1487865 RepID=A0ABD5NQ71_9EURY|nr:CapA family protein [Halovivax cerinus]